MKTYLDCIPCFLKQSLEAARMVTNDEKEHEEVLKEVMVHLQHVNFKNSPPENSREIHHIIRKIANSKDPYKNVKSDSNKTAKKKYRHIKKLVEKADDTLLMVAKLSIVGNVIDFGTTNRFEVEDMIDRTVEMNFKNSGYKLFKKRIKEANDVLYLADNAGEIFFDKILLEEISKQEKEIIYVVKSNPIINDATKEDAFYAGINRIAKVIEGDKGKEKSAPGMILKYASREFLEEIEKADMVISKGQGNYESLSNIEREIFFLLMVKCPLVARDINTEVGEPVLKVKG